MRHSEVSLLRAHQDYTIQCEGIITYITRDDVKFIQARSELIDELLKDIMIASMTAAKYFALFIIILCPECGALYVTLKHSHGSYPVYHNANISISNYCSYLLPIAITGKINLKNSYK